jgi:hypothetical protein
MSESVQLEVDLKSTAVLHLLASLPGALEQVFDQGVC